MELTSSQELVDVATPSLCARVKEELREGGGLSVTRAALFMLESAAGKKKFAFHLFRFPFHVRGNRRKLGVDGLIFARREQFERTLKPCFRLERPGSVFLDIGANYGYWSRYVLIDSRMRKLSDVSVVCFEPLPANYELLVENMKYIPASNSCVRCEAMAVGDAAGTCFMNSSNEDPGSSFASYSGGSIECAVTTVDGYVREHKLRNIALMKVDVEGFELRVLRGAGNTIRRDRPLIICEVIDSHLARTGASKEELMQEMLELGYSSERVSDADYVFRPAQ